MKKRICALLLCALLCACCAAIADDFGEAVIDGRSAEKVHLREEPTTKSESLGLYFTGTEVDCLSDPDEEWVKVKIGREDGYMLGKYLKIGAAADAVKPIYQTGYTTAPNYARLRMGDSTEHKMVCQVLPGDEIRIHGETDAGWYYVTVGDEEGFISKNLVRVYGKVGGAKPYDAPETYRPQATPKPQYVYPEHAAPGSEESWQAAYLAYLKAQTPSEVDSCALEKMR